MAVEITRWQDTRGELHEERLQARKAEFKYALEDALPPTTPGRDRVAFAKLLVDNLDAVRNVIKDHKGEQ